jgi:hypothetical protein
MIGVVTFALLGGLVAAAVLHGWLGVLPGSYLASTAAIALFALAVSAALAGLGRLLGQPGLGLGALVVFMVGNPLSGVSAAPELLPQPWGAVGQWLPIGAGGTLLRSAAYFDWAGSTHALLVLAGWAVAGLALIVVAQLRRQPSEAAPLTAAPELDVAAPALAPSP